MNQPDVVVTLVHGTFVQKARWCNPDSPLCSALTARFRDRCVISVFPWSGKNAHGARLEAGERLSGHLGQLSEQYPKASHFVIAHSHGGNVASYALRNESLQTKIRGVIYLATPHLQCRPRDLERTLGFLFLMLLPVSALLAAIPVATAGGITMSFLADSKSVENAWWGVTILGLVLFGLLCWWVNQRLDRFVQSRLEPALTRRQQEKMQRLNPPFLATPWVLNVSTPFDEAGLLLRTVRLLAAIPFALWNPALLMLLCGILEGVLVVSITFYVFDQTASEFARTDIHSAHPGAAYIGSFLAILSGLAFPALLFALISLFLQLLMLLVPKVVRGQAYGFGGETLSDNLLVDIEVTDVPFAAHREDLSRRIAPMSFQRRRLPDFRLAHCSVYDDEYIVGKMVDWIEELVAHEHRPEPLRVRSAAGPLGI